MTILLSVNTDNKIYEMLKPLSDTKKTCSATRFFYKYARATDMKLFVMLTRDFMINVCENHAFSWNPKTQHAPNMLIRKSVNNIPLCIHNSDSFTPKMPRHTRDRVTSRGKNYIGKVITKRMTCS